MFVMNFHKAKSVYFIFFNLILANDAVLHDLIERGVDIKRVNIEEDSLVHILAKTGTLVLFLVFTLFSLNQKCFSFRS